MGSKRNIPSNLTVTTKMVTVLAFNVRKTHTAWGGSSSGGAFIGLQQSFLACLLKNVDECRGTVDTFQGDRVLISFNAVRNVATHGRLAAVAGFEVIREMGRLNVGVTAGMSTGRALIGNMGVQGMMKFNVVGPVVGEAVALERVARIMTGAPIADPAEASPSERALAGTFPHTTPFCMHSETQALSEVQGSFLLQPMELAWRRIPKTISAAAERERVVVLSVNRRLAENADTEEWMYELADKQCCNPCAPLTEAYLHVCHQKLDEARSLLASTATVHTENLDSPDAVAVEEATAHLRVVLANEDLTYAGWWF